MPHQFKDPNLAYHILGSQEDERAKKTFIREPEAVAIYSRLQDYAQTLAKRINDLRVKVGKPALKLQEVLREYSGPRRYRNLHAQLTSHHLSEDGFGVRAAVEAEKLAMREEYLENSLNQKQPEAAKDGTGPRTYYR